MAQLIAAQDQNGIVLAADGHAHTFEPDGTMIEKETNRLVQLGPQAGMICGGPADSADMGHAFKEFIKGEELTGVDEIYAAALPFLGGEYDRHMRRTCEIVPIEPLHQIFFILGGRTNDGTNKLYMIWTKRKLPYLDGDEIENVYAAPRRMGLEYKLANLCRKNAPLDEVLGAVKKGMEGLSDQEEVGPPFKYATITAEGFKEA
jgi:hypothetical protein